MEEKLKETSVQEVTIPQASSREMPKPTNIEAKHLPRDSTKKMEALANEGDTTKGDETNGLGSNLREILTGPTVVKLERPTLTSALSAMVKAKPGLKHPQDPNISSRAAGTVANQHSPPPKQSRDAGGNKVRMVPSSATPSRSLHAAPTPEDKRGTSRDTPGVGAKGTTKETITPPTQDSVDADRPSSTGAEGLSHREKMSKSHLPGQTPKGTDSQPQELGKDHKQPRNGERTARKEAKAPIATSASNTPPTPTNDGKQVQPSRFDTTHEPD